MTNQIKTIEEFEEKIDEIIDFINGSVTGESGVVTFSTLRAFVKKVQSCVRFHLAFTAFDREDN